MLTAWIAGLSTLPQSAIWTLTVLVLSVVLLLGSLKTKWRGACAWIALAAAGQAAFLQLVEAGPESRMQQLFPWSVLLHPPRAIFLAVVGLQVLIVMSAAVRGQSQIRAVLARLLRAPSLFLVLALLAFAALPVPTQAVRAALEGTSFSSAISYSVKACFVLVTALAGVLSLAFAAAAIPKEALERWAACWHSRNESFLPRAVAVWVVIASASLCWIAFDALPHVPDDVAYLFHAKYFAAGKLYLPRPADAEAFRCGLILADGDRFYSAQLPAWPAVLAIGAWLGVPWLVNPVLAGLTILVANRLLRRLYNRDVADATVLLLALSPWFLFMSATFMGHTASLFFSVLGLYGVQRAREDGSIFGGAVAGLSIGMLVNMRPLEALAIAGIGGVWWLAVGWKRLRIASMAATAICGLAMLAIFPLYNRAVTGYPRVLPFEKVTDENLFRGVNRVGFGKDVGNFGWGDMDVLPGHGPIDVAVNTNHNLSMVNFELYGWPGAALLLVFALLARGRFREDGLLWGLLFGVWAAMSCYWFSGGPDFGARYWYQMIVPLAALTVRGAQQAGVRLEAAAPAPQGVALALRPALHAQRVWAFVAVAGFIGAANLFPWRTMDKYKNYRYVRGEVRALARQHNFGKSLVFIRADERGLLPWHSSAYGSAFSLNPLTLDPSEPGTIYARDIGPESVARIRASYPDRPAWFLEAPRGLEGHFRVVEGPVPPLSR
jgi:hypothetical protein